MTILCLSGPPGGEEEKLSRKKSYLEKEMEL